jgi:hypothetical protein
VILSFARPGTSASEILDSSIVRKEDAVTGETRIRGQRKVKVIYSRSMGELRIDTSASVACSTPGTTKTGQGETFRTRRVAPLVQSITHNTRDRGGPSSIPEIPQEDEAAAAGLGVAGGASWSEMEREGLRRLWALRREWGRYP